MDHVEVTTTLDVASTREVVTAVAADHRYDLDWDAEWSATARRWPWRIGITVFAVRPGLTVVQLHPSPRGGFYFASPLTWFWIVGAANRLGDAITEALGDRER